MKNIVTLVAISLFTISSIIAQNDTNLKTEISEKVNIDLRKVNLNQNGNDFVQVKFKINDGLIQIVDIEASQVKLKDLIISELMDIRVRMPYSEHETHNFKFTFELI